MNAYRLLPLLILPLLAACKVEIKTVPAGSGNTSQSTTATTEAADHAAAPDANAPFRVATYNIQFFNTRAATDNNGERVRRLKQIIADIKPDVMALQEIDDRAALELLFPKTEWNIVIDDDSDDEQDLAYAVRSYLKLVNIPADLDADDEHYVAPGAAEESFFPNRRDGLLVTLRHPQFDEPISLINVHPKARVGGRTATDSRRVGSSRVLVDYIKARPSEQIIVLGDFNDTPDDQSLNVLETGDLAAPAGMEENDGPLMTNFSETLWAKGLVTEGASDKRLDRSTGQINNVYPEARVRNDRARAKSAGTGPIMFDQILATRNISAKGENATVFTKPIALTGPGFTRPSDHLPAYVDFSNRR